MIRKTKGRAGGHQATPKTLKDTGNHTHPAARVEAVIVKMIIRGLLPVQVSEGFIRIFRRGGLRDE
jgi:hypothetical protein